MATNYVVCYGNNDGSAGHGDGNEDGCHTTEGTTAGILVGTTEAKASRGTRTTTTTANPYLLGRQRPGGVTLLGGLGWRMMVVDRMVNVVVLSVCHYLPTVESVGSYLPT